MSFNRSLAFCLFCVTVATCSGQTFIRPHLLDTNGKIGGIVYDPTGGFPEYGVNVLAQKGYPIKWTAPEVIGHRVSFNLNPEEPNTMWHYVANTLALKDPKISDLGMSRIVDRKGNGFRQSFRNGYITDIELPVMDKTVITDGRVKIKTHFETGDVPTQVLFNPKEYTITKSTPWKSNLFILEIEGVNCSRVNKIEAITIKQKSIGDVDGDGVQDFALDVSDLIVEMPEDDAMPLTEEYLKPSGAYRNGRIHMLNSLGQVMLTFQLNKMSTVKSNPLYKDSGMSGSNPLYDPRGRQMMSLTLFVSEAGLLLSPLQP